MYGAMLLKSITCRKSFFSSYKPKCNCLNFSCFDGFQWFCLCQLEMCFSFPISLSSRLIRQKILTIKWTVVMKVVRNSWQFSLMMTSLTLEKCSRQHFNWKLYKIISLGINRNVNVATLTKLNERRSQTN